MKPCTVAAKGRASSAPTIPIRADPAMTEPKATATWISMVWAVIRGESR